MHDPASGTDDGSPPPAGERVDFFAELKRRKVYRVGAAYVAAAFAVIEGADLVFPALGLPPVVYNALVVASLLGFPVALFLSWTFDITPRGTIRRTDAAGAPGAAAPTRDRWGRVKAALVGAGFVAVLVVGFRLWKGSTVGSAESEGGTPDAPAEAMIPETQPVLAVLPFDDLSPEGDQAYFTDGLHEELLHQLAVLRGIRLVSRTSVDHFRDSPATVGAIADSLGARYVLEGSVRRAADSVRLTVQLIDAATDEHIWSESHDSPFSLEGVFAAQSLLARRVAASLGGTLGSGQGARLGRPPTSSLEAYNLYLRGLHHLHQFSAEGLRAAADDLERAVALDPEFGRAHGLLATVYVILRNQGMMGTSEAFPLIRREAELAMRLAPDEPESRFALASVHWTLEWDWEAARQDIEAALALDPNSVDARWALAEWYGVIAGDTERGLEEIRDAQRLDPLATTPIAVEAWILAVGRRFGEAAEVYGRLSELEPGNVSERVDLARTLAWAGRTREADSVLDEVSAKVGPPLYYSLVAPCAALGDTASAREYMDRALAFRQSGGQVSAAQLAVALAALGQKEAALDWLERSFEEEGGIYWLRGPGWAPLHSEPRFQALWERVGLPGPPPAS